MDVGSNGQVCFRWNRAGYPAGCYAVVQTSEFTFTLRGLARQPAILYSIKP